MPDTEALQSDRSRSTPQESRERLRQRKQRKTTSCWLCRERKVKCDKLQPCDTCSKRGHPNLCLYEQSKNRTIATTTPRLSSPTHIASQPTSAANASLNTTKAVPHPLVQFETPSTVENATRPSSSLPNDAPEAFLGENSTPSFVRDQRSADGASGRRTTVERALMPILGLNEAPGPYPFLPLVGDESNVHNGLPPDLDVIKYFQHFRMQLQAFTPIIADILDFEAKLGRYLDFRARQSDNDQPTAVEAFSPEWIGLTYAVLASGVQFSDLSNDQRSVLSHKYAQYAFQCLRLGNFLMRPTVDCLQTFLVLGNVLQNAMKPEAAWIMMGTTARIAQSLGLHKFSDAHGLSLTRRKLWLAVVWQDTLLSLCFDRPSATMITLNSTEFITNNSHITSDLGYTEAMYAMVICSLRGLKVKETAATAFDSLSAIIVEIEQIYPRVKSHLRSLDCCKTFQERCEYYALRLHISFAAAWISRGAFRQAPVLESELQTRASLITKGKEYLIQSLKAYLQLQTLCIQASRSWAFIHNGLSSALFLGLIGETKVNPEVRKLQGALIDSLSASDSNIKVGQNVALSKLHERALAGLKSLYSDQSSLSRPGTAVQPTNNNLEPPSEQDDNATGLTQTYTNPETFPYDMVQNNYQPVHMPGSLEMLGMSPMEIFDSMMWDPNFTSDGFEGLGIDTNPEPWIF